MLLNQQQLRRWIGASVGSLVLFGLSVSDNETIAPSQAQVSNNSVMDLSKVNTILEEETNNLERVNPSQWKFQVEGQSMVVIADENHDRIRIVAPITQMQETSSEQVINMLVANYHTSLDARYAVNQQGMVTSVFLHPLSSLQEEDFRSALNQVAQLAITFGTDYSSGELNFDTYRQENRELPEEDLSI